MTTKYRMQANVPEGSRVIVLSETNMSIEDNQASVSGTYTNEDLTNNSKIILARRPDGETFGYGNVSPVGYQSGPDVPFTETFDGAEDTQVDSALWTLNSEADLPKGALYGDGRWRWYSSSAVGVGPTGTMDFAYKLDGNFDVILSPASNGTKASSGYSSSYTRLRVVNDDGWQVGVGFMNTTIATFNARQAFENLTGTWNQDQDLGYYSENSGTRYRIYRVNGDTIRVQYNNQWDGGGAGSYWESPVKYSGPMRPGMVFREGSNNSYWRVYFYTFEIVAGTIV